MKTKLFLLFFLSIIHWSAKAQNSWAQKANFGGLNREQAVSFVIGSKVYMGLGFDASTSLGYKDDFWEWDVNTNVWTQKANFPGGDRGEAVGFSIGTKGYVGTGVDNFGQSYTHQDFWEYDPGTDTWTQKTNYPGGRVWFAVGFSINDKGYIGTGSDNLGVVRNDFYEYDPVADSWSQKANFGGTPREGAVGFSIGNNGYIGTGYDGTDRQDFWEYSQANDTWVQKANFAGVPRYAAVGFSIGSLGYIGTGTHSTSYTYYADFWQYNPSTDTWTQKTNYGVACQNATGCGSCAKGYIGTGAAGSSNQMQNFMQYSPSSAPTAAFTVTTGGCVDFTDASTSAPTSWSWSFPGATPNSSTLQNPTNICFPPGTHSVTLIASNINCTSTVTQTLVVVGVEENYVGSAINIFPNPTAGVVTIDAKISDGYIMVHNIFGDAISFSTSPQLDQTTIDLSNQPNGIYFVSITTASGTITRRITISK